MMKTLKRNKTQKLKLKKAEKVKRNNKTEMNKTKKIWNYSCKI